ncbi:carbohydrate-binding domain-containing protein [Ruminococcus sp.]|uniref:carbohydrate-binding domain-containing protein n=1 Tax=Ruminococcus sp. TaxID=41978 RepID=UPI0025E1647B|nr:carbohydrate-binding domain-containing protein [Ruminococcus sp.]MCR4639235.1 carbohydrate-binding domain-containing protein [Ruminococcus sp.]
MKKKSLIAGILSACIVGSAAAVTLSSSAADKLYGDANLDGSVDMSDCVLIMQSLANPSKYGTTGTNEQHITADGAELADVSERGNGLTSNDALSVQRYLLGMIKELPESYSNNAQNSTTTTAEAQTTTTATTTAPAETVTTLPKEDVNTKIHLNGSSIQVDGKYAEANGSKVTISHSGSYTIDGTLNNGQIYVEIPDEKADPDTVKLVFNGVNITGMNAPAVLIKNADKTSITLADGTENTVSDGTSAYSGDDQTSAVIEAKDDLTIKGGDAGTGILNITANVQPAIVCNNDIKFTGGITNIDTLNLTEANDAVKGKSSVLVKGGQLNINSEGDGIKSSKGNVDIEGGEINIKCGNDAIQAETALNISGGKIAAFGDRGLTSAGTIAVTGGDLLATATDNQCENLTSTEQNTIMIDFAKEWSKNNPIALTDSSNKVLFDQNTSKKYRYAIISSAEIGSGEYKLFAGGIKQKHSSGSTFTGGKPAAYKDVNNDMENEEQLYGSFFDLGKVHKIDVKMSESDWNAFMNVAQKEEWYPCDLVIDGEEFKNVGIRTKGNSSRMMVNNGKYSFRFKLDKYEKLNNYHGLTEFCMNNFYSDASCMRDLICYDAMYNIDGVAPKSSYSDMYVNGKLYSFYYALEQPGTTLAERYAIDDDSNLYKATERSNQAGGGGMWGGMGGGDSYSTFTNNMPVSNLDLKFGTDEQLQHLEELKTAINKVTTSDYKFIEDIMDVPSFLKGFAVNSVMCNYDSYNGSLAHNYYLMYTGGKHYFVGWDYNLCLGIFMDGASSVNSDINTSLYNATVDNRPFAKLLQIPEYYKMYVGYVNEIMDYYKNIEQYVANYSQLIRPHVEADPRFAFSVDQFVTSTTKSANGLQGAGQQGQQQNPWGQQQGQQGQQQNPWGQQQGQQGQQQDPWGQQQGQQNQWDQQQQGQQNQWGQQGNGQWNFQFNSDEPDAAEGSAEFEQSWAFEGGFGGGGFNWNGGGGGFGGGGMFGNNSVSVIDFLLKRFEVIRSTIKG